MLPKVPRVSSILGNRKDSFTANSKVISSGERLSYKSSSSSSKSAEDGSNVHVDNINVSVPDDTSEIMPTHDDGQSSISSNPLIRRMSKRTIASFNERHYQLQENSQTSLEPIYAKPSLNFSNPLRRLNSLLRSDEKSIFNSSTPKTHALPLYSSTAKKSSSIFTRYGLNNDQSNNRNDENELKFPPPPPCFLYDNPINTADSYPIIRASGPGLSNGFISSNCHFDLNAPDAELQKLVIAIDGPSKADIQIEIVEKGIYRVFYTCQSAGNYHISITYDGAHINGSPYALRLDCQPNLEQVVPPTLPPPMTPPIVTIEPTEFYVNIPSIVCIRPAISCTIFQAYIRSPQSNMNLPIMVHKSARSEWYEIYFIPPICGNYWLNVSLNHIPVADNPRRLLVRSSSSLKPISGSSQGSFHAYTDESSHFFVSKSFNDLTMTSETFSVGVSGPVTLFLDVHETEHGYEFHYKPSRAGKYIITIKNGGKHVPGSPFICQVYNQIDESKTFPSAIYGTSNYLANETGTGTTTQATSSNSLVETLRLINSKAISTISTNQVDLDILRSSMTGDASKICVFGTGLYEAKPKRKASFKIDASQSGPGLLLVGLYSSVGPCERLVIKRISPASTGFIYKVSYRARARGQYMLVILYGSNIQHVPGSPYLVTVE